MTTELRSLVLFLFFIFAFSSFYHTKGNTSLYKKQSTCNIRNSKIFTKKNHDLKNRPVLLSFDIKKDNQTRKDCRSGFCKKTSGSIFDDMIVRSIDTTLHFKYFEIRLHHFEFKKDVVYHKFFSRFDSNRNLNIHPIDYYIYSLRKIIT